MRKTEKYRVPPATAFRRMGLGQVVEGRIKVVAGFRPVWWSPDFRVIPLIVEARVIRFREKGAAV